MIVPDRGLHEKLGGGNVITVQVRSLDDRITMGLVN